MLVLVLPLELEVDTTEELLSSPQMIALPPLLPPSLVLRFFVTPKFPAWEKEEEEEEERAAAAAFLAGVNTRTAPPPAVPAVPVGDGGGE